MELWLYSQTLVWYQTRLDGNLAMAIFMSRVPPLLWHKHAITKSGGPIVPHSYAMNTHACKHSYCNCMFVPENGWNSGYIHGLLHGARQGVELWVYSWTLAWCQTGGGTLGIFMDSCMVPDRGWNSGYIHGLLHGARQGVELWVYLWTLVWCQTGVEIWLYSCIVGWTQVKFHGCTTVGHFNSGHNIFESPDCPSIHFNT